MIHQNVSPRSSPIAFLTVVLVTTCLALIWMGWYVWSSYEENKISKERNFVIEDLHSTIIHLDEVLTMSARMAAATGDIKWEKRYKKFEPKLESAIKMAISVAPEAYSGRAAADTDAANIKLVNMENLAFDLVRQGRVDEARRVLFSDEYKRQKLVYTEGMTKFATQKDIHHRLKELRGIIIHLDEVLTMSARMAAATGDLRWEERYRKFEPKLDTAIKEVMKLAPEAYSGRAAADTDAANIKLVNMENLAFDLVRQGHVDEAKGILFSGQYETQKQIYAKGMAKFAASLSEIIAAGLKQEQHQALLHILSVMLLIPLLFISLFFVFRVVRKWQVSLSASNRRLTEHAEELDDLNKSLDDKVVERTKELEESYNKLTIEIKEREEAKEEQKKLEAQLQQAQKMEAMGTLAGGIAHDFNNLLMGIQGNASLMLLDIDSGHPNRDKLQAIEKMVQSGSSLTRQLLGYARKGRYEVKPINLNQRVMETSETFGRTRKEITIHRELEDNLFGIEADQVQVEQVLLNLYANAADAMPGGGDLILKTRNVTHEDMGDKLYKPRSGKYVQLNITDKGTGMDKETIERIFEPFFTTKEMGRGTGLGLASAYGIIKAHGGYIDVESERGYGTTFNIYLPASEKEAAKEKEFSEDLLKGTETVLFVDDEEIIIDVGEQMLKGLGYTVLLAKSGKEAIDVYKEKQDKIDMVILDMIMPGVSGGETYDRIKEMNPRVKVLLSSGYSIEGQATEILERGCDGFIQKPFNIKELSQKLREILDKEKS